VGVSSKKKIPYHMFYMDPDQATEFAANIAENTSEHGLRLDIYVQERTAEDTGRKFLAAYGFVKPKQASDRIGAAPTKKVAGPVSSDAQVQSQIDKIRVKAKT
jgi:hypothetical protein